MEQRGMGEQGCRNKTLITEKIKLKESVAHTTSLHAHYKYNDDM